MGIVLTHCIPCIWISEILKCCIGKKWRCHLDEQKTFSSIYLTPDLYNTWKHSTPKLLQKSSLINCSFETVLCLCHSWQRKLNYLLLLALQQCGEQSPGALSKTFILFLLQLFGDFNSILFVKRTIYASFMRWGENVASATRCLWEFWKLSFWGMNRAAVQFFSHMTKWWLSRASRASCIIQWLISFKDRNYLWSSMRIHKLLASVLQKASCWNP